MTATPQDFIKAGVFILRDNVAKDDLQLTFTHSTTGLSVPVITTIGSRIKVSDGTHNDNYRITTATTGSLATGVSFEWVDVGIAPKAVRAYAPGINISFEPYAVVKKPIPDQSTKSPWGTG